MTLYAYPQKIFNFETTYAYPKKTKMWGTEQEQETGGGRYIIVSDKGETFSDSKSTCELHIDNIIGTLDWQMVLQDIADIVYLSIAEFI